MDLINKLDTELLKGRIIDSIECDHEYCFTINFTDGSFINFEHEAEAIVYEFIEREDV